MTTATATTALTCAAIKHTSAWGSSRCGRQAIAILRSGGTGLDFEPICKLHLSHEERRAKRYGWLDQLADRTLPVDHAEALDWLAKRDADRRSAAEKRAAEEREQARAAREHRLIREQQEMAEHWLVKRDDNRIESYTDDAPERIVPRWTWTTTTDDDSRGYYSREITVETSYKDDARFPAYVVARNSNGTLSPREARALAQALLAAADVADQQPGAQPETEA